MMKKEKTDSLSWISLFFALNFTYINPWMFKSFSRCNSFKWIDCKHLIDEIFCFRCDGVPFWRRILNMEKMAMIEAAAKKEEVNIEN